MDDIEQKSIAYQDYIKEHSDNVALVWEDCKNSEHYKGMGLIPFQTIKIEVLIIDHDQSKYSREEFKPYRDKFFPIEEDIIDEDNFKKAWNHHQKSNPHHWQYWLMWKDGETTALEMDLVYVIEMLIDWTAMSYKFGDTPKEFYDKNKDSMLLHEKTRLYIELYLPLFTTLATNKHSS